jgi:hypothetical protein
MISFGKGRLRGIFLFRTGMMGLIFNALDIAANPFVGGLCFGYLDF